MGFIFIIFIVSALAAPGQMANTIFVPAMDMMAKYLHTSPHNIQGFIAAYLLPYGISQFIYGPLADKYGRKPIIHFGLIIFAMGALFSFSGYSYLIVMIGCILQGIGAGVGGVMCRTIMRDCYKGVELQKANSYMTMTLIIAPLIAPILGGLIAEYTGWQIIFLFLFLFAIGVFFVELKYLKETRVLSRRKLSLKAKYLLLWDNKTFLPYTMCLMLTFSGVAVFEACCGVLLGGVLKMSPSMISLMFIVPIPFYIIGSYMAGLAIKFFNLKDIMFYCLIAISSASVITVFLALINIVNIYSIIIPVCILFFGAGVLFPTATTGAIKDLGRIAGIAGAVLGGLQNISAGIFTALSSLIPQTSQMPLGLILTILSALMIVIYYFSFSSRRKVTDNSQQFSKHYRRKHRRVLNNKFI